MLIKKSLCMKKYNLLKYIILCGTTAKSIPPEYKRAFSIFNNVYGTEVESVIEYITTINEKRPGIRTIEHYIKLAEDGDYHILDASLRKGLITQKEVNKTERKLKSEQNKTKINCAMGDFFIAAHILFESLLNTQNRISPDNSKDFSMALIGSVMSNLKQCTTFFAKFQKIAKGLSGAYKTAKKKRKNIAIIEQIIKTKGICRPQKIRNPISEIVQTIKSEYKLITGKNITLTDKTIENHIYDYFNRD